MCFIFFRFREEKDVSLLGEARVCRTWPWLVISWRWAAAELDWLLVLDELFIHGDMVWSNNFCVEEYWSGSEIWHTAIFEELGWWLSALKKAKLLGCIVVFYFSLGTELQTSVNINWCLACTISAVKSTVGATILVPLFVDNYWQSKLELPRIRDQLPVGLMTLPPLEIKMEFMILDSLSGQRKHKENSFFGSYKSLAWTKSIKWSRVHLM